MGETVEALLRQAERIRFADQASEVTAVVPQRLYRGVRVRWTPEEKQQIAQMLEQQQLDELADLVANRVATGDVTGGVGRHWSRSRSTPELLAGHYEPYETVILGADWDGQGEDPDRTNQGVEVSQEYSDYWRKREREHTLLPGTPLNVTSIQFQPDYSHKAKPNFELLKSPRQMFAAAVPPEAYDEWVWPIRRDEEPPQAPPDAEWFHVTTSPLPIGTLLRPGWGKSPWPGDSYNHGMDNRALWVWLEHSYEKARDWTKWVTQYDQPAYVYRVQPYDGPFPFNGSASEGWVSHAARVEEELAVVEPGKQATELVEAALVLRQARAIIAAPPRSPDVSVQLAPAPPQAPSEPAPKPRREPQPVQKSLFPQPKKSPRPEQGPEYNPLQSKEPKGIQMPLPSGPDFRWSESLPMDKMYKAVVDKYNAAPEDIREWGSGWYDAAHEYIQNLAQATNRSPDQVAAVMAAFSPQTAWDPNMSQATHFLLNYDENDPQGSMARMRQQSPALGENIERAQRLLQVKNPADRDELIKALSTGKDAPKITNFYKNMMGDRDAVTIDTWMARALMGEGLDMADSDAAQQALGWAGSYDRMSEAVQRAAKDLGVDPRALQAIVWTQVNPTADYGDWTPESYRKRKDQREKSWRKNPTDHKRLPDYTKGPAWNSLVTPNPGAPLLPPPVYRNAPGYHKAAIDEWRPNSEGMPSWWVDQGNQPYSDFGEQMSFRPEPGYLWRGLDLYLHHPGMEGIRDEIKNVGPHSPKLGPMILQHLQQATRGASDNIKDYNEGWRTPVKTIPGLGAHWSASPQVAANTFAMAYQNWPDRPEEYFEQRGSLPEIRDHNRLPVVIRAADPGTGIPRGRSKHPDEQETFFRDPTQMTVDTVLVQDSRTGLWHRVLQEPTQGWTRTVHRTSTNAPGYHRAKQERRWERLAFPWSRDPDAARDDFDVSRFDWDDYERKPDPKAKWYHASPHDLPEGTELIPGGGESPYKDWYERRPDRGETRKKWLWLHNNLFDMRNTTNIGGTMHVYEVEPAEEPRAWNNTGNDGWVTPRARIKRKVYGPLNRQPENWQARSAGIGVAGAAYRGLEALEFKHDADHPYIRDRYSPYDAATAYVDGVPVGYVQWDPRDVWDGGDQGRVKQIYVDKPYREQGIATDLYRWVKDNVYPDLRHDPDHQTGEGMLWADFEETFPKLAADEAPPHHLRAADLDQWRAQQPAGWQQYYEQYPDQAAQDFERARETGRPLDPTRQRKYPGRQFREVFWDPNRVNPPDKKDVSRPPISWQHPEEDPRIPGAVWPKPRFTDLHRGLSIDLDDPRAKPIRDLIQGGDDPDDLYEGLELPGGLDHPELHQRVLDYLENNPHGGQRRNLGLGQHWTPDEQIADDFATSTMGRDVLPVKLRGRWSGAGEDPDRMESGGSGSMFAHEKEITLTPGAPIDVTDLQLWDRGNKGWKSVLPQPSTRRAKIARGTWQIKDLIPSDYDWLEPTSRVQAPTGYPQAPVEYENHNDEPSGKWFHVSPHELPPGTRLTPGGGSGLHDQGSSYYESDSPLRNRRNHIWLAPNMSKARYWRTQFGDDARIYEVDPGDKPQRWNYTGSEGWVAPSANVLREIPLNRQERRHPSWPDWDKSRREMGITAAWAADPMVEGSPIPAPEGASWYHVSPHELPPGTKLTPGGGQSDWEYLYKNDAKMRNRQKWVWMEHDPQAAASWVRNRWWNEPYGKAYVYRVKPSENPQPWNFTGEEGWASPEATIEELVGAHDFKESPANYGQGWQRDLENWVKSLRAPTEKAAGKEDYPPPPEGLQFRRAGDHGADVYLDGDWVGEIKWADEGMAGYKPGEVQMIRVSPDHRNKGIGTALYDWTKQNVAPHLQHSDTLTPEGAQWTKEMFDWDPSMYNDPPPTDEDWDADVGGLDRLRELQKIAMPTLYRGINVTYPDDLQSRIERAVKGVDDPHLGSDLLKHLAPDDGDLGSWWSEYPERAEYFASGQGGVPTVVTGDWGGKGENLSALEDGEWDEGSHYLDYGTPVRVDGLRIYHDGGWRDMPITSVGITAMLNEDLGDGNEVFVGGDQLRNLEVKGIERKAAHQKVAYEPDMNIDRQLRKFDLAIEQARSTGEHDKAEYITHLRQRMLDEIDQGRPQPYSWWAPMVDEEFTASRRLAMPAEDAYDTDPESYAQRWEREYGDPPPTPLQAKPDTPWYHVSPYRLPPGAKLIPRGGKTVFDFYYDMDKSGPKRQNWVWLENDPKQSRWWSNEIHRQKPMGGPNYIYRVRPSGKDGPHPWNGHGGQGWVADEATIEELVEEHQFDPEEGMPRRRGPKPESEVDLLDDPWEPRAAARTAGYVYTPDGPRLEDLIELPDSGGRWSYPHDYHTENNYREWRIEPTDAPASHTDTWYDRLRTVYYDPARVGEPRRGEFRQEWERPTRNRITDLQPPEGMLWRGMSHEEYEEARQRGYFESRGDYNLTGDDPVTAYQKDKTFFTTQPDSAETYASSYAPYQHKPTFSHPAHIVGIPDRPDLPRGGLGDNPESHEVGVPGRIPFSEVRYHYVGHPTVISPGSYSGYYPTNYDEKPSRSLSPSVDLMWEPADDLAETSARPLEAAYA